MIDQFQSEVGYLGDRNSSPLENLIGHNIKKKSTNFFEPSEPKLSLTEALTILYFRIRQSPFSYDTGIHFYPSTTITDLGQTIGQYSRGAKCQSLIFRAGHNSIDNGVLGVAASSQLCETVPKAIKKLKTHRVLLSEFP